MYFEEKQILVSVATDNYIKLWNVEKDLTLLKKFNEHKGTITSLIPLYKNRFFATGSWDTTIKVWDVQKENSIRTI